MIKCFLSHSSSDKESYVRVVAARMRKEVKVFDEVTFEKGMVTSDEIADGLDQSTLFVIFLSDAALESPWVQGELAGAKQRFDDEKLKRIYPIIIDEKIQHDDRRIPEWMREKLNIQPIFKPTIAARKINARLLELSWATHPRLRERQDIFVGRNDLIETVEERLDDFVRVTPVALIASGLPSIGRKALLQKSLKKANLVRDSYDFPFITLSSLDSIEDFILKIHDLGIFAADAPVLSDKTIEEKIEVAKKIALGLVAENERIIIEDHGVIVQRDGELVDWFQAILVDSLLKSEHVTFCIASQFRLNAAINRTLPAAFGVSVKELEISERNGLLLRYSRFLGLNLARDDLAFFSDLLTGLPEQVFFAVDLISEQGLHSAKKQSHTVQQYASDKAQVILEKYKDKQLELNLIYLLSRFEFLSYDVLFDLVPEEQYGEVLNSLMSSSICEKLGAASDYVRVNEVVRDYVARNRFRVPSEFEDSINRHVKSFVENYKDDNYDISDYLFSAQEALKAGNKLPQEMLTPSVFVKTIKQLYDDQKSYSDVVALADRVLEREKYLHVNTAKHVRFLQCQSLARQRAPRFFDEVRKIPDPDRSFLYGFYYRLAGNFSRAEENLLRLVSRNDRKPDPRATGELVLVYMQSEEYEKALALARTNYEDRPINPINANNYFTCLIAKARTQENREELEKIVARLSIDPSDRAQEMADSMRARVKAYYEDDEVESMSLIEATIERYPDVEYPLLTKADLAVYFHNIVKLREAVDALERGKAPRTQTFRSVVKFKAMLLAMDHKVEKAHQLVRSELGGLMPNAAQRLHERLDNLANT